MYRKGEWVTFEGAGTVEEVYECAYSQGAGYNQRGVRVRVRMSDKPGDTFIVHVPIVCVQLADSRDKQVKASGQ